MNKIVFKGLQKLIGAKFEWAPNQRAFDFVLVGARNACIVTTKMTLSPLFHKFFDVYEAYPENADVRSEDFKDIYSEAPVIIVKKGTKVEHVFFERDGLLFYRHVEIGILLGFPPVECENFNEIEDRIGVDYYGLQFACERRRFLSAIAYLEETFSLPAWMMKESELITR